MCKIQETQQEQGNCHAVREWILEIHTVLLLAVFPFYNTDQYFSILSDRAGFFRAATLLMAEALLAEGILRRIFLIHQGNRPSCTEKRGTDTLGTVCAVGGFRTECGRIPSEYLFLGVFLFVSAISTLLSEYPREAWSGEAGRLQGLSMWLVYGIFFFCTARFFHPKKRHLYLFLVSGAVVALWGICDYLGPGLSWWLADVRKTQKDMFTSSIGNINTYTAFIVICFSLSGAYIVHADKPTKKEQVALVLVFVLFSEDLITGRSDNAIIGIAVFFLILPLSISNTRQIGRCLCLLAAFAMAFPLAGILSLYMENPYLAGQEGILLKVSINSRMVVFAAASGFAVAMLSAFFLSGKEKALRSFRKTWAAVLAIAGMACALVFLHANFFAKPGQYGAYLIFNDDWGTCRGLCWRLACESYARLPFIKKLAGAGPETFGIIMKQEHYQAMIQGCGQIFDSPHNEFIQYMFCTGILGAACYYAFLATCFVKGAQKDAVGKAAAAAALAYVAVSFVNISVPITQPYLIMLAAWCSSKQERRKEISYVSSSI